MEITLDILQANPEVNIIFGANDEMGLGALAACEQIGRGKMDNGKPLTEVIAGLDGNVSAMLKIFNPNSSFKLTHGAVRDNARQGDGHHDGHDQRQDRPEQVSEDRRSSARSRRITGTTHRRGPGFLEDNFLYKGNLQGPRQGGAPRSSVAGRTAEAGKARAFARSPLCYGVSCAQDGTRWLQAAQSMTIDRQRIDPQKIVLSRILAAIVVAR